MTDPWRKPLSSFSNTFFFRACDSPTDPMSDTETLPCPPPLWERWIAALTKIFNAAATERSQASALEECRSDFAAHSSELLQGIATAPRHMHEFLLLWFRVFWMELLKKTPSLAPHLLVVMARAGSPVALMQSLLPWLPPPSTWASTWRSRVVMQQHAELFATVASTPIHCEPYTHSRTLCLRDIASGPQLVISTTRDNAYVVHCGWIHAHKLDTREPSGVAAEASKQEDEYFVDVMSDGDDGTSPRVMLHGFGSVDDLEQAFLAAQDTGLGASAPAGAAPGVALPETLQGQRYLVAATKALPGDLLLLFDRLPEQRTSVLLFVGARNGLVEESFPVPAHVCHALWNIVGLEWALWDDQAAASFCDDDALAWTCLSGETPSSLPKKLLVRWTFRHRHVNLEQRLAVLDTVKGTWDMATSTAFRCASLRVPSQGTAYALHECDNGHVQFQVFDKHNVPKAAFQPLQFFPGTMPHFLGVTSTGHFVLLLTSDSPCARDALRARNFATYLEVSSRRIGSSTRGEFDRCCFLVVVDPATNTFHAFPRMFPEAIQLEQCCVVGTTCYALYRGALVTSSMEMERPLKVCRFDLASLYDTASPAAQAKATELLGLPPFTNAWSRAFPVVPGLRMDVMDQSGLWATATIIRTSLRCVTVTFDGWNPRWNEIFSLEKNVTGSFRALWSHTINWRAKLTQHPCFATLHVHATTPHFLCSSPGLERNVSVSLPYSDTVSPHSLCIRRTDAPASASAFEMETERRRFSLLTRNLQIELMGREPPGAFSDQRLAIVLISALSFLSPRGRMVVKSFCKHPALPRKFAIPWMKPFAVSVNKVYGMLMKKNERNLTWATVRATHTSRKNWWFDWEDSGKSQDYSPSPKTIVLIPEEDIELSNAYISGLQMNQRAKLAEVLGLCFLPTEDAV